MRLKAKGIGRGSELIRRKRKLYEGEKGDIQELDSWKNETIRVMTRMR